MDIVYASICALADYGELKDSFSDDEESDNSLSKNNDPSSENGEEDGSSVESSDDEAMDLSDSEKKNANQMKKRESLFVLRVVRSKRNEFVGNVKSTKPGFDGEYDRFDGEYDRFDAVVTDIAASAFSFLHRTVGHKFKKRHWDECQTNTHAGYVFSHD